ncbi:SPW repeat domain-containing protein [Saccharothrix algeriensis]|uniref:SPW repeat-containing integral membrane domain-containing protein n=1 Tax=Saccharothrix algeriensis TaxID=173560 RepID=A0ABS2S0V0_9PSEU|nr:SPW repeat protein [Saccharothrix algeriensis]MBM7809866.1 hypothetical protein [Saccharothrix algeriensis]
MSGGARSAGLRRRVAARLAPVAEAAASFGPAVSFLAGLWLVMAPFALGYDTIEVDFGAHWNSVLVGFAVAVCSLVHVMAVRETPWLGVALLVMGTWLVVAPPTGGLPEAGRMALNDVVTGGVVVVASLGAVVRAAAEWRSGVGRRSGVRVPG